MLPTITRSAPPATPERASEPPNWPIWIWFARSAALVCAPPLIDCMSTSSPRSLKLPFSNAYHMTQSSALMLLYAATTFLQQAIGLSAGPLAVACACVAAVVGVAVDAGCPPHAATSIAMTAAKTTSLSLISTSRVSSLSVVASSGTCSLYVPDAEDVRRGDVHRRHRHALH